jgi:ABC-2 type transport system permease protein
MLAALMRKELLALRRDPHALGALFVMPAVFIVVMSLALANLYSPPLDTLPYAFDARESSGAAQRLMRDWTHSHGDAQPLPDDVDEALRRGALAYVIELEAGFGAALASPRPASRPVLRLRAEPGLDRGVFRTLHAQLAGSLGELRADALIAQLSPLMPGRAQSIWPFIDAAPLADAALRPSAVQHNVPAWLVFGMFFVVTAIAGLFVQEQHDGALARLASLGVPHRLQVLAKALPYVGVNLVQAAAMLAVGVFALPLFGGQALSLTGIDPAALVLVLLATSLAAIGLALLVACLARSHAQANAFGPLTNIVLAALGGIMVPTFVMPPAMQAISAFSPMNWGLEGLHVVLLRHGGLAEAAPWALQLALFGLVTLALASALFSRRITP